MQDVTVKGIKYRIGTISAMAQFHVIRRLAPLINGFKELDGLMTSSMPTLKGLAAGDAIAKLGPLTEAIASLKDADTEYVINTCLRVVERKQPGGGYASIMTADNQIMFEDIDMIAMLALTAHVIGGNMQGFFAAVSELTPGTD